jgi:hypothetical protein
MHDGKPSLTPSASSSQPRKTLQGVGRGLINPQELIKLSNGVMTEEMVQASQNDPTNYLPFLPNST